MSEIEKIPRGYYTRELREEAVKLVVEGGESVPEVGKQQKPLTELGMELHRVKREPAIVVLTRWLHAKA